VYDTKKISRQRFWCN